jgi:hypothetical protein
MPIFWRASHHLHLLRTSIPLYASPVFLPAQSMLQVLRLDPGTGAKTVLLEERSDVWVNLHHLMRCIPSAVCPDSVDVSAAATCNEATSNGGSESMVSGVIMAMSVRQRCTVMRSLTMSSAITAPVRVPPCLHCSHHCTVIISCATAA